MIQKRFCHLVLITIVIVQLSPAVDNSHTTYEDILLGKNNISDMQIDMQSIALPELIGIADLIVLGKINNVYDKLLHFEIINILVGDLNQNSLVINQFTPKKSDGPRKIPYKAGQKYLFFLHKKDNEGEDIHWSIIGLMGEGEMLALYENIYFLNVAIEGLEKKQYLLNGTYVNAFMFKKSIVIDAINSYVDCFRWTLTNINDTSRWIPEVICDAMAIEKFKRESELHNFLVTATLKSRNWELGR